MESVKPSGSGRAKRSRGIVGLCILLPVLGATTFTLADVSLIRNDSITSLDPVTPPLASLFDPQTGLLLGENFLQSEKYVDYDEPLVDVGYHPLVLYQLDDPNQTLFVTKLDNGQVTLTSFDGRCTVIRDGMVTNLLNTIPVLFGEYSHAQSLFGTLAFDTAIRCDDDFGVLGASVVSVFVDPDTAISLTYLRAFDAPRAFIRVRTSSTSDMFNGDGGLRVDDTDPDNPIYIVLDASGQPVSSGSTTGLTIDCNDLGQQYQDCLNNDDQWRDNARLLGGAFGAVGGLVCKTVALATPAGAIACGVSSGLGLGILLYSQGSADCTVSVPPGTICPEPPGYSAECVATFECHPDAVAGHPYCVFPSTASCTSDRNCGGPAASCDGGVCQPETPPETCNNRDDNCDGIKDMFPTTCGVGPCVATGVCVDGVDSCVQGTPAPDDSSCNGVDDDCDVDTDEDYVGLPTSCGVGACASTGATSCVGGTVQDSCAPGTPSPELCDGVDNNCNGTINDEVCDCVPAPEDMVSWWKGEGNALDSHGSNHAVNTGVAYVPGIVGTTFSFSGAGNRLQVPHHPSLTFTTADAYTIDLWVRAATPASQSHPSLIEKWESSNGTPYPYVVRLNSGSAAPGEGGPVGTITCAAFDGTYPLQALLSSATRVDDGNFHHVACVFDHPARTLLIYIDGVLDATRTYNTLGAISNSVDVFFGVRGNLASATDFSGEIDEATLYARALSSAEIESVFAAGANGKCVPP